MTKYQILVGLFSLSFRIYVLYYVKFQIFIFKILSKNNYGCICLVSLDIYIIIFVFGFVNFLLQRGLN